MKKENLLKFPELYLLLFFLTFKLPGTCQTSNPLSTKNYGPNVSLKAGDALPSTGMEQMPPQIVNVATVAPDVLCIEIDACNILPSIQIPYQPDPSDVVKVGNYNNLGEPRSMYVIRNGFPLGSLAGTDRPLGQSAYIWGYLASRK
jgi:hypothetical protein